MRKRNGFSLAALLFIAAMMMAGLSLVYTMEYAEQGRIQRTMRVASESKVLNDSLSQHAALYIKAFSTAGGTIYNASNMTPKRLAENAWRGNGVSFTFGPGRELALTPAQFSTAGRYAPGLILPSGNWSTRLPEATVRITFVVTNIFSRSQNYADGLPLSWEVIVRITVPSNSGNQFSDKASRAAFGSMFSSIVGNNYQMGSLLTATRNEISYKFSFSAQAPGELLFF